MQRNISGSKTLIPFGYSARLHGNQEVSLSVYGSIHKLSGQMPQKQETLQGLIVNLAERMVFYREKPLNLSNREFDIVEFLMRNANQIFDKERIYEAVRKYHFLYTVASINCQDRCRKNKKHCSSYCPDKSSFH